MYKNIEFLLFDLGGVLIELTGVPKILKWMNNRVEKNEINNLWLFSPAVRKFETGKLTPQEFAKSIIEELELCVDTEQFIKDFTYFPSGFYIGAKELINELGKKYTVACLSNTNQVHWDRFCNEDCIESMMPVNFPSHKTGFMKPDREAYLNVIKELNCNPDRILFFDDNQINVDIANEIGMKAICVSGFENLKLKLKELGIV